MGYMAKLKNQWGYEKSVPRCGNCVEFKLSIVKLTVDSNTTRTHTSCKLGGFNVSPNGVCDKWHDKAGTKLE